MVCRTHATKSIRALALAIITAWASIAPLGAAQDAAAQEAPPEAPAAEAPAATEAPPDDVDPGKPRGPTDPLNRGTPRGSMHGFLTAVRAGDYEKAVDFLDLRRLPPAERDLGPTLARHFHTVLDQTLWVDYASLSPNEKGHSDDDLPSYRDQLGRIQRQDGQADLLLQRVPREGDSVRIWKIAAETVEQIPSLYDEFGYGPLEAYLPPVFFEWRAFDMELWQWLGLMLLVLGAWLVSWALASLVVRALGHFFSRTTTDLDDRLVQLLRKPMRLLLAVFIVMAGNVPLALSLSARAWILGVSQVLLIVAFTWGLLRIIDLVALVITQRMLRTQQPGAVAIVGPGKKTIKALLVVIAGIAVLGNLGFNITALVAGFGVGGIAVALAAQKTVENLFGGVMLFSDRPVRVGDFCRFGDSLGTVEEIGLRSTRVRSLDRTLITIPNGEFSSLQLENYTARDRIRLTTVLGLRYETTPEQLRYVLTRLRELLLSHPKLSEDPARVRFVGFGAYSLDLEVTAYAFTTDWSEFLTIREDVYLRAMDVIAEAGTGFAFPSSTTYVAKDDGLDATLVNGATERVEQWRLKNALPFPEFSEERRGELRDTLDWPPEGSPDGGAWRPRRIIGTDDA